MSDPAAPWLRPKPRAELSRAEIDLARVVALIPNDGDWNEWNRIGLAIFAASNGSDQGAIVFDDWSAKSPEYNPYTTAARWRHYHRSPPIPDRRRDAHVSRPPRRRAGGMSDEFLDDDMADPPPRQNRRAGSKEIDPENGHHFPMQRINWLWPGWLARGKFHLLAGGKGTGKSTITFDLMARVSTGMPWPDGSTAPLGDVLVWSGEDGIEDTILPRFVAAGGNLARIYPIKRIRTDKGDRPFDPSTDIDALIDLAIRIPAPTLIIIDPIVMALPAGSDFGQERRDTPRSQSARRVCRTQRRGAPRRDAFHQGHRRQGSDRARYWLTRLRRSAARAAGSFRRRGRQAKTPCPRRLQYRPERRRHRIHALPGAVARA